MIYTFKNNETGEVYDKWMSLAEREVYLKDNPHLSTVISAVPLNYRGTGDHFGKSTDGFKDRMKEIKKSMPPSDRHMLDRTFKIESE